MGVLTRAISKLEFITLAFKFCFYTKSQQGLAGDLILRPYCPIQHDNPNPLHDSLRVREYIIIPESHHYRNMVATHCNFPPMWMHQQSWHWWVVMTHPVTVLWFIVTTHLRCQYEDDSAEVRIPGQCQIWKSNPSTSSLSHSGLATSPVSKEERKIKSNRPSWNMAWNTTCHLCSWRRH